jgi:fermentation-respiration switch protein FrsA (DUF1100 family)
MTALLLAMLLLMVNGWLFLQQPAMIFFPSRIIESTPTDWGLAYEEVDLTGTDGVRLHGWYLPYNHSTRTLLFLHGNGGNISHRGESLRIFHRLGLNVLIIDYRGYGRSEGSPSENGLYQDSRSAWRYLTVQRGIKPQDIVIFGRSLGGAVAAELAAEVQPAALIIESSFSSTRDVAKKIFPLLSRLSYLRYDFDAAAAIKQVHSPILVLHSPQDEIIPYELGEKLYLAANAPKVFQQLRGDHNTGFLQSRPGYEQGLRNYLSEYVYSR